VRHPVIAPTVAEIAALCETLIALTDDGSVRFSLLDLDAPAQVAAPAPTPSPAERAADAALSARRAEFEARKVELLAERGSGSMTPARSCRWSRRSGASPPRARPTPVER
jgi:hypothetical protein